MPSIDDIMKAAQSVQAEMAKAQAKLDTLEVEGASGGGMVKVRATAKGRILKIDLDPSLLTPNNTFPALSSASKIRLVCPA